ncbi:MAG: SDR family oxidoreductase, partial [Bacteriovoracaceae bacterium]
MEAKSALILGASTGLGKSLAKQLAQKGFNLILAARNSEELNRNATDLAIRYNVKCHVVQIDLSITQDGYIADRFSDCLKNQLKVEYLFLISGLNSDFDDENIPDSEMDILINTNFVGPSKILKHFVQYVKTLPENSQFFVVTASTIAVARMRGRNLVYASSKIALEAFVEGIRHATANLPITLQTYRLGYVDTLKSYGQKLLFPSLDPHKAATKIISNLSKPQKTNFY